MDVAASEFKVEGQDCYDLGTWYPDAEQLGVLRDEKEECEMGNLCREDMLWESENKASLFRMCVP